MPATITRTVKSSGGDYSSLSAWESGEQGVLTAAWGVAVSSVVGTYTAGETLNFVGSGATGTFRTLASGAMRFEVLTGTPAVSDVITGATSLATSTLDSITYSDGEVRQAECYAFTDTSSPSISGSTTDATRYRRVYAAIGAKAAMPWSTQAYILESASAALTMDEAYSVAEDLQLYGVATSASLRQVISATTATDRLKQTVKGCYVRVSTSGSGLRNGIQTGNRGRLHVINCVVEMLHTNAGNFGYAIDPREGLECAVYNCTAIGPGSTGVGFQTGTGFDGEGLYKNCLASGWATDFAGDMEAASDYNASEDATAPGANARQSQTFTFRAADDWHLAPADAGARGFGIDLSGDAAYPFSDDFDAMGRRAPWDIGADQFAGGIIFDHRPIPHLIGR